MVRTIQTSSDRAPDYANVLSQYKGGKSMGSRMARLIEIAMELPPGWMDTPQFENPQAAMDAWEAMQLTKSMSEEDREAWMRHGRLLAERNEMRQDKRAK